MARSLSVGLFAGFGALLLLLWAVHVLWQQARPGDEARLASFMQSKPSGDRLLIEDLKPHERVVIRFVMRGHGHSEARTLTFTGGESIHLEIADQEVDYDADGNLVTGEPQLATSHALTSVQAAGVDALLRMLRTPQAPPWRRYYDTYEVEYIRDGVAIGREKMVEFAQITWRRGDAYEHLPADLQALTTPEDWPKLIDLRELARTLRLGVE